MTTKSSPCSRWGIQEYLAFGFARTSQGDDDDPLGILHEWSRGEQRRSVDVRANDLVVEGAAALAQSISMCAAQPQRSGKQVVLLSGGMDSRVILASLLREFDRSEIVAATFGQPGEHDYDYAAQVANTAGVEHVTLESFSIEWSTEGLVDSILARDLPLARPFGQRYLGYQLHRQLGSEHTFWDGLCGDVVSGSLLDAPGREPATWDSAVDAWLRSNLLPEWKTLVGTTAASADRAVAVDDRFDPTSIVPHEPIMSAALLPYSQQLGFALRQTHYIAGRRLRGYLIQTPFLRQPWLDFMLSLPVEYRYERPMYREILRHVDPVLSSLPLTTFGGGSLTGSASRRAWSERRIRLGKKRSSFHQLSKGRQASGANEAIRSEHLRPGPIRELFRENLEDLDARGVTPWLDAVSYLDADNPNDPKYRGVNTLLGLELNLKARDKLRASAEADDASVHAGREGPGGGSSGAPSVR